MSFSINGEVVPREELKDMVEHYIEEYGEEHPITQLLIYAEEEYDVVQTTVEL